MTLFQAGDVVTFTGVDAPVPADSYLERTRPGADDDLTVGEQYVVKGQHMRGCVVWVEGSDEQHQANRFTYVSTIEPQRFKLPSQEAS